MADTPVYHLRITTPKNDKPLETAKTIWNNFKKRFNPTKYLVCYEESEKGQPHIHARIQYDRPPKQVLSDYFKRQNLSGKYHHELEKDKLKNELYILKDQEIIDTNYIDTELNELWKKLSLINADKKKYIAHKIMENLDPDLDKIARNQTAVGLEKLKKDIGNKIDQIYVLHWDKLPPSNSLKNSLVNYYIIKKGFKEINII